MNDWLDSLKQLDVQVFRLLNSGHWGSKSAGQAAFDPFMLLLSEKWPWAIAGVAVVGWSLWKRRSAALKLCLLLALTLSITDLVTFRVLKPAFARARPCYQLSDVRLVQPSCGSDYGLPSNHAANAMATATVLILAWRRRWTWGLPGVAVLVGASRVYLGAHYPGDVLLGFVTGGLLGWLCFRLSRLLPWLALPPPEGSPP
jgi:undecaprenyl-diphosphatase